jgi:hypothetical protein
MIDRQQLESILVRRFPGAALDQIAAAANAIMGLDRAPADRRRPSGGCAGSSGGPHLHDDVAAPLPLIRR